MFSLTSKEQKALFFVAAALALSLIVRWALPHRENPGLYDYSLKDSLFKALSADTLQVVQPSTTSGKQKSKQANVSGVAPVHPSKKRSKQKQGFPKSKILKNHSIDINSAKAKNLEKLPGIGPKTAQAIVAYRNVHGPFTKLEQLKKVKRIGPKTLKKIEPYIILRKMK